MDRVKGKVALVTGGASGIGKASAGLLAAEGATVVLADIDETRGEAAAAAIRATGGSAGFHAMDVAREEAWRRLIDDIVGRHGRLDVLVNNAGIAELGNVEETSLDDWRRTTSINLDGVFLGVREGIRAMKANGGGSIVNLSSIEGIIGDPNLSAYNASKGGVRLLTKCAALHCAQAGYGIRVNSVHPGYILTPMVEAVMEKLGDVASAREYLESLHPLGRLGEPIDIAYGILYLASDESKFMTGSELVIDGGYTAR
jgi:NAD(P)-dependent dehydrogenase (short-subunit alcohol dehydrogenase family)